MAPALRRVLSVLVWVSSFYDSLQEMTCRSLLKANFLRQGPVAICMHASPLLERQQLLMVVNGIALLHRSMEALNLYADGRSSVRTYIVNIPGEDCIILAVQLPCSTKTHFT